eukprot:1829858-Pyramimonas_sp.AAC.1
MPVVGSNRVREEGICCICKGNMLRLKKGRQSRLELRRGLGFWENSLFFLQTLKLFGVEPCAGVCVDVKGACVDVRGACLNVKGACIDVKGVAP